LSDVTEELMIRRWTALCAYVDTPRGTYDEEVDVDARNESEARRKAQALLDDPATYRPGLRVRRVERLRGFTVHR